MGVHPWRKGPALREQTEVRPGAAACEGAQARQGPEARKRPDSPDSAIAGLCASIFAPDATAVRLCLFDEDDREVAQVPLERDEDLWRGFVAGAGAGQRYGLRADGP